MAIIEILVPDLGGAELVEVIEINVKPGESIDVDTAIVTLESDKATMEVPAPLAGILHAVHVKVGDKISTGHVVATLEVPDASAVTAPGPAVMASPSSAPVILAPAPVAAPSPVPTHDIQRLTATAMASAVNANLHATPVVRRLASEFGIDLARIVATGPKGRILKEDVQAYVKQQLLLAERSANLGFSVPEMPIIDFSQFGASETQALTKIKKLTGIHLSRNWVRVPHVTQFDEADITALEAARKEQQVALVAEGVKLTPLIFIMQAVVAALQAFPQFNAALTPDGQSLILKKYFHLGIAVDTPQGLVVPVIRDVDQKDPVALARALAEVSEKARQGKLLPKDMQGGCFTISSLGGIGGIGFTPIVNAPEVAILGVSRAQLKPVYTADGLVPRLMLPLSLSYDHRVIDGAEGARFTRFLCKHLQID